MSKIKFHKANALPNPLTEAHDGIWFIFQAGRTFKVFIVSNGNAFPLDYEDAVGNYIAGEGINIISDEITLKKATDSEIGGVKIWKGTQAQYNAIPNKDAETLYFIEDSSSNIAVYNIDKNLVIPSSEFNVPMFNIIPQGINIVEAVDWEITWKESYNSLKKLSSLADFYDLQILDNPIGTRCRLLGLYKGGSQLTIPKENDIKLILYYE